MFMIYPINKYKSVYTITIMVGTFVMPMVEPMKWNNLVQLA